MRKQIHLICGKCGSDEIAVNIEPETEDDKGVSFSCKNCIELTGIEELVDQQNEVLKNVN